MVFERFWRPIWVPFGVRKSSKNWSNLKLHLSIAFQLDFWTFGGFRGHFLEPFWMVYGVPCVLFCKSLQFPLGYVGRRRRLLHGWGRGIVCWSCASAHNFYVGESDICARFLGTFIRTDAMPGCRHTGMHDISVQAREYAQYRHARTRISLHF